MNIYLRITWRTALLLGTLLILMGVIGLFLPLVPEIAVILLGLWLLCAVVVNSLGRRRSHQQDEQHHSATPVQEAREEPTVGSSATTHAS